LTTRFGPNFSCGGDSAGLKAGFGLLMLDLSFKEPSLFHHSTLVDDKLEMRWAFRSLLEKKV
jgi:hypothetical protein